MCGFPLMHLDKYLKVLVQQNKRFVAICEEFMRDRTLGPKGGFDRRVTRIVTPGTLIDEPFLNAYENNYLISIAPENVSGESPEDGVTKFGLAWIDVSTGDFFTKSTCLDELRDELVRIGPKEVVLDRRLQDSAQHPIRHVLAEEGLLISYAEVVDPVDANATGIQAPTSDVGDDLTLVSGTPIAEELMQPLSASESKAVELLAAYMHANLLEHMPRLTSPNREVDSGRMQIDAHTLRALEIRESMREGGVSGTLFSVVKRTVTTSGTRLLARWLCRCDIFLYCLTSSLTP